MRIKRIPRTRNTQGGVCGVCVDRTQGQKRRREKQSEGLILFRWNEFKSEVIRFWFGVVAKVW